MKSAVVIGASFAGLLTAAALARNGLQVTVLERDRLTDADGDTTRQPRSGVPQSWQPHILLHRGLMAIETLVPGIEADLLAAGGVPFNTGQMPWLGEFGWMPQTDWAFEIISISRPVLEAVVRRRVVELAGVEILEDTKVDRLVRDGASWQVLGSDREWTADLVVDASGRGSRLPHWLTELGLQVPEAEVIEAKVGYATRTFRGRGPVDTGMAIAATPSTLTGGLALPIEDGCWLVAAAGYGDLRPGRTVEEFNAFLRALPDPALADLAEELEPIGEVVVHRQTGNRRTAYGRMPDWPAGLLAVGDALCAFNPVYGQGITVAACEAELLGSWLGRPGARMDGPGTRVLQRRIAAVTELPWSVATSEDLRMPTSPGRQNRLQRLTTAWTMRMGRLMAGGDETCTRAFARVYHLMGSPLNLISPPVLAVMARSLVAGIPPAADRPIALRPMIAGSVDEGLEFADR